MSATLAVPAGTRSSRFTRYAWGVLGWNLLVILWGAYVRASGSGAGCGSHWPLCNGEVVPRAAQIETIIEFTHRMMSGAAFLGVLALVFWSRSLFPRGHRARRAAMASFVFLIVEALLGAGLVLFQYVTTNASVGRAIYLSMHLVNTQLLLAMLAMTAWFSRYKSAVFARPSGLAMTSPLALVLLVSVTGAITALGDTLFPATSLAQGMRQDVAEGASFLLRLRVVHPVLAVATAVVILYLVIRLLRSNPEPMMVRIGVSIVVLTVAQLGAGVVNLVLLAPIGMQIFHLLLADLLWIALVLLVVEGTAARGLGARG
jgi:heme a synthase